MIEAAGEMMKTMMIGGDAATTAHGLSESSVAALDPRTSEAITGEMIAGMIGGKTATGTEEEMIAAGTMVGDAELPLSLPLSPLAVMMDTGAGPLRLIGVAAVL